MKVSKRNKMLVLISTSGLFLMLGFNNCGKLKTNELAALIFDHDVFGADAAAVLKTFNIKITNSLHHFKRLHVIFFDVVGIISS